MEKSEMMRKQPELWSARPSRVGWMLAMICLLAVNAGGQTSSAVLVKDINPGAWPSTPQTLTDVNGTLFFIGPTDELWRSDGTVAGTVLVRDDLGFSSPKLTNVSGILFFATSHGLWRSDGTAAGTVLVTNVSSILPGGLTNVDGTLFFATLVTAELWKSGGTATGTMRVRDFRDDRPITLVSQLIDVNGTLFFIVTNVPGFALWKSDGTAAGTVRVKNFPEVLNSTGVTNVGGTLFFAADDGTHGWELWKSDGTEVGTVLVKDIFRVPAVR